MTKHGGSVDLDGILTELGHFGRYQVRTYCLILVPIMFSGIYNSQYVFNAADVNYRCQVPECDSSPPDYDPGEWGAWALPAGARCERRVPVAAACAPHSFLNETQLCDAWVYENYNTIVGEFGLACQGWKRTLVGTVHSAGMFAALCMTGMLSDTFGRRLTFILTATSHAVTGSLRVFSTSYVMYIILEFVDATLGSGIYSTGFILALEMVSRDRRVLGGNLIPSFFALGQVTLALAAWACPNWKTLTLVIYIPSILFLSYFFLLGESVRWLLSKGRRKDAANIIFKAAAMNKVKLSPESIKQLTEEPTEELKEKPPTYQKSHKKKRTLFSEVMRSRIIISRLFICSFWWVSVTFIYYGLSINSVSLAGNMYVNYILMSLVEIPGYALSILTLDRFGRKSSIMTAFFICAISLFTLPFISSDQQGTVAFLNLSGKMWITMAIGSVYIYTSELFPTVARHSLLNVCSMVGRVGQMLAPQTPLLMSYMRSLPYLVFGTMAACSALLMLMTPETLRMRLPDTVAQAENIVVAPRTAAPRSTDIIVD